MTALSSRAGPPAPDAAAPAPEPLFRWRDVAELRARTTHGRPVVLVERTRRGIAVGPVLGGDAVCFPCFLGRRSSHGLGDPEPVREGDAGEAMGDRVAGAVARLVAGSGARQLELLPGDAEVEHWLFPLPHCTRCWASPRRELPRGLDALVSDRLGLVHEVTTAGADDTGLQLARATGARTDSFWGVRAFGSGAAVAPDAAGARTCALGEAIERYCAAFWPMGLDDPPPTGAPTVVVGDLLVPSIAGDPRAVRWRRGRSLRGGGPAWVAAAAVHIPYRAHGPEPRLVVQTSTGLAAGPSPRFAVEHAAAEVIERDVFMRAWRGGSPVEAVPPPAHLAGVRGLHLARIPSDTGLHVVAAFLERSEPPFTAFGLAARPELDAASAAATAGAVQTRIWLRERLADPSLQASFPPRTLHDHALAHATRSELRASRSRWLGPARTADRHVPLGGDWRTAPRLAGAVVVDVTTADVRAAGLTVVRLVAPGTADLDTDATRPQLPGSAAPHPAS